jgi:hypothetical protein
MFARRGSYALLGILVGITTLLQLLVSGALLLIGDGGGLLVLSLLPFWLLIEVAIVVLWSRQPVLMRFLPLFLIGLYLVLTLLGLAIGWAGLSLDSAIGILYYTVFGLILASFFVLPALLVIQLIVLAVWFVRRQRAQSVPDNQVAGA